MLRLFLSCLLVGSSAATLASAGVTLTTCNTGVGFSAWPASRDSRISDSIVCADGGNFDSVGITKAPASGVAFAVKLRSLGKGVVRQGFRLGALSFSGTLHPGIITVCITTTAPLTSASGSGTSVTNCGGALAATDGSPFFEDTVANNARFGWQFYNPTSAATGICTTAATTIMNAYLMDATATTLIGTGYITVGAYPRGADQITSPCVAVATASVSGETSVTRRYGDNVNGYLQLAQAIDGTATSIAVAAANAPIPGTIMGYPGFALSQPTSAMGFQLGCDKSITVDQTRWVIINFWDNGISGTAATVNAYKTTDPSGFDSSVVIQATCQNVATTTPTPPFYPASRNGFPSAVPFPLSAGAGGSSQCVISSCVLDCLNTARQSKVIANIQAICLQNGNVGCSVVIACIVSPLCVSNTDILLTSSRRGLKQTGVVFLQQITVTSRDIRTIQYLLNQVRTGALEGEVSAYSWETAYSISPSLVQTPVPVPPPSVASPNFAAPSPNMPWTGLVEVTGTCTASSCTGYCNGGAIVKVTNYNTATDAINCFCLNCNVVKRSLLQAIATTRYEFQSTACVSQLVTQAAADACAANVAQDVVCWVLNTPGVSAADIAAVTGGLWQYRPPAVAGGAPRPFVTAPTSCPNLGSHSNKGLLGLLGLLGIIPIVLCCCLLLLCCLRRKKREGDVHFATFDPQAANMGAPCSVPAMGLSPMGVPCM